MASQNIFGLPKQSLMALQIFFLFLALRLTNRLQLLHYVVIGQSEFRMNYSIG